MNENEFYKAKLLPPTAPNFIRVALPSLSDPDENQTDARVPISSLSAEQKDELARAWREQLDIASTKQRQMRGEQEPDSHD